MITPEQCPIAPMELERTHDVGSIRLSNGAARAVVSILDADAFDQRVLDYRRNKYSIIPEVLSGAVFLYDIPKKLLSLVGDAVHREDPRIDAFLQEAYCDCLDYCVQQWGSGDFSQSRAIFGDDMSLVDMIDDPVVRFRYMMRVSQYFPHYGLSVTDLYDELFPIDILPRGREFFDGVAGDLRGAWDTLSLILLIDECLVWADDFQHDTVRVYLSELRSDIVGRFPDRAIVRYVADMRHVPMDTVWIHDSEYDPVYPVASDRLVYNPEHSLPIGFFEATDISDLSDDTEPIGYPRMFSDIHDTLSSSVSGEEYAFLVQMLHRPEIMARIGEDIGIRLSDYPFAIQPHFLVFLAYATVEDFTRVRDYLSRASTYEEKYARLRTFLATGEDRKFGDLILRLESELVDRYGRADGARLGNIVFGKYSEIMAVVESDAAEIRGEYFGADSDAHFSKSKYIRELMKRSNDILSSLERMVADHPPLERLETAVSAYDADMMQYGALFRIAEKDAEKPLDEALRGLGITHRVVTGSEATDQDRETIRSLYDANYQGDPTKTHFLEYVRQGIEEEKGDESVRYHFFEYDDRCLLTAKFVEQPDGSVYFGAFNTELQFQPYGFGIFVLEKLLDTYADRTVHGHVLRGNEYLMRYYQRYGFVPERDESGRPRMTDYHGIECYPLSRPPKIERA